MDAVRRGLSRVLRAGASFAVLLVSACIETKSPIVTPQVSRVAAVRPTGLDLALTLHVQNPNDFQLAVQRVEGTVYLGDNKRLGESSAQPGLWIGARQSAIVESRLQVPWQQLPTLTEFWGRSSVPYRVLGKVTLGGKSLNVTLPFQLAGQLSTEQLLAAGLRGLPRLR